MPQSGSRTSSWAEYQARIQAYKDKYGNQYDPNMVAAKEKEGQNVANAIAGGPVGWFKAVSGKDITGDLLGESAFDGTTLSGHMTEEVYNNMTDAEWKRFSQLDGQAQLDFIRNKQKQITAANTKTPEQLAMERAEAERLAKEKARGLAQDDLIKKVTEFANLMNMPISELMQRDEFAQALNANTYQNVMGSGMSTGAGAGGLSQLNADMATKRALLGYQFQRQQAGQQAMQSAFGMLANQNAQAEDILRYNQGMNLQFQEAEAMRRQQEYMQGMGAAQGRAGLIGGIIGGIAGGPTGAAMGQQIGSGMGGQRYQNQNPYKPYQFNYPSSTRPQSGMSGRQYGGNY